MKRFLQDEEGAALIEYTALFCIMILTVIGVIRMVGMTIKTQLDRLEDALPR